MERKTTRERQVMLEDGKNWRKNRKTSGNRERGGTGGDGDTAGRRH